MGNPTPPPLDYATPARHPGRARLKQWLKRLALALLVVTCLYAAPLAWLYVGWKQEQPAREMVARVGGVIRTDPFDAAWQRFIPARLGWMRERVTHIALVDKPATDDDVRALRRLSRLKGLYIPFAKVTDAGLVHLRGLTGLQSLYLGGTQMTDAELVHLRGLTGLQDLYLGGTQVTDAGLVHLRGLAGLRKLNLFRTQVTDGGVAELQKALPGCQIDR